MVIYHITSETEWDKAKNSNKYAPDRYTNDGFIHCSKDSQTTRVANARFKGRQDVILLEIDTEKVLKKIVFEQTGSAIEPHPHIYGPLNKDAVLRIYKLTPDVNGFFSMPKKSDIIYSV